MRDSDAPLTPEQWQDPEAEFSGYVDFADGIVDVRLGAPGGLGSTERDRHALAALALHGQPFGFTADDVWQLEQAVLDAEALPRPDVQIARLRSLAARIAALLPPAAE